MDLKMLISSLHYLEDGPPRFTDVTNAEVERVTAFSYMMYRNACVTKLLSGQVGMMMRTQENWDLEKRLYKVEPTRLGETDKTMHEKGVMYQAGALYVPLSP